MISLMPLVDPREARAGVVRKSLPRRPCLDDVAETFHAPIMDTASLMSSGPDVYCAEGQVVHYRFMDRTKSSHLPVSMRPESIGPRLRAAREALGLSKAEMADSVSVDRSLYGKYEGGKRQLTDTVCYRLAERHGLTMDFLFRGRLEGVEEPLRGRIFSILEHL